MVWFRATMGGAEFLILWWFIGGSWCYRGGWKWYCLGAILAEKNGNKGNFVGLLFVGCWRRKKEQKKVLFDGYSTRVCWIPMAVAEKCIFYFVPYFIQYGGYIHIESQNLMG